MRSFTVAASALLAFGITACSSDRFAPAGGVQAVSPWSRYASVVPVEMRQGGFAATIREITARPERRKSNKGGLYVSTSYGGSILGYSNPNLKNDPPFCTVASGGSINDIAVDAEGYLIVPSANSVDQGTITVFRGPGMCGSQDGLAASDPYGRPVDAASADASVGTIVVANLFDKSGSPGSVSLCIDVTGYGCTTNLTNPAMYRVGSVALAKNGDCWASAENSSLAPTLIYFQGCKGSGQQSTGYLNNDYGGLDIDAAGNLVSISGGDGKIYVYKGCNPACTLVGGPFQMQYGDSFYGHLDKKSKYFAVAEYQSDQIDVYKYRPTKLTYDYSFNNGMCCEVIGVAFNPRSKE